MSTAMIVQTKAFLERKTTDLTRWCRGGVQATPLILMALQDLAHNPATRDATPQSVYNALLACAVTGLEPGSLKQEAFLVPFKREDKERGWLTEVKFLVGWRGIVKQAHRAGGIRYLRTGVVHEGDVFEIDNGSANVLVHRPRIGTARGPAIGAFALAKLTNGETQHEFLDIDEIEQIRAFAEKKKPSPAWQQWWTEMARKSAARRLGKYLPMDESYFAGARIEAAQEATDGPTELEVIDSFTEGAATADAEGGGPVAGFAAGNLEPQPPGTRRTSRSRPSALVDTQATDVPSSAATSNAAPASPPSDPSATAAASASPTTASSSPPSAAPTSRPATSTPAPASPAPASPVSLVADEDAGMANEPPVGGEEDGPAPAATAVPSIHGWPATISGYAAWANACTSKQQLTGEVGPWKAWAKDVMHFDPGYKPKAGESNTLSRDAAPELVRMSEIFNARWRVLT